jgi:hypothetical protein
MSENVLMSRSGHVSRVWNAVVLVGAIGVSVALVAKDGARAEDIPSDSIGVALILDGDENVRIFSDSGLKVENVYENPEDEGIVTLPEALSGMKPVAAVFVVEGMSKVVLECHWVGGTEICRRRTVQ